MGQGSSKAGKRLCAAISRDDTGTIQQIASDSPDAVLYKTFWKRKTPLMIAAEAGDVLAISTCLWASEQALGRRYQSYINDAASSGNTALMLACKRGHAAAVRVLLEEGGSPLPANRRGETAVHLAAVRGNTLCLELVLEAPVRALGGGTPLAAMAAVRDHAGETRFVDAHDRAGFTALHLAAIQRAPAAVAALVAAGAALDVPVLRGMERMPFLCGGSTPLHIAAAQGDVRTCLVLLEGQARHPGLELRRVRNMLGLTPLNCALLGGHHEVVRILVDPARRPRGRGRGRHGGGATGAGTLPRMVSLDASFPDSLRHHMMGVLQRAALLLQLREIAGGWRAAGAARPSDGAAAAMPGLDSLSLEHVERMRGLLQRRDASLRDVLCGLEATLQRARSTGGGGGAEEEEGSEGFASAASTPTAAAAASASVDWTLVGRSAEAGQLPPAGLGGALQRRRRERRRAQHAAARGASGGGRQHGGEAASPRRASAGASLEQALAEIAGDGTPRGGDASAAGLPPVPSSPGGDVFVDAAEEIAEEPAPRPQGGAADGAAKAAAPHAAAGPADDCAICMDDGAEVCFHPCAHSMCFACACKLCCRNGECITCPFCRAEVTTVVALAGARAGALAAVTAT